MWTQIRNRSTRTIDDARAEESGVRRTRASIWVFWLSVAALLPLMVLASLDFGATWDEQARHLNGIRVFEYLQGLRNRAAAEGQGVIYPALFDVICAWLEATFPLDRYVLRHALNATFGWIGILFAGRLAGRLFGGWAGVLAVVLLVSSPRFFADSMNNPKDLPFAAMGMVALYYLSTISPRWPYLSLGTGVKIAVALALGLSTRPVALLYLGYLPLLIAALALVGRSNLVGPLLVIDRRVHWNLMADTALRVLNISVAVLFLGTVFWPWASVSPLTRPFTALGEAAEYGWNGTVLFNGENYPARELPSSYLPIWFLISTPPVVMAGMALSLFPGGTMRSKAQRVALWIAAVGPVALIVVRNSTVYDGMRHALFVYPVMVVLAAAGWAAFLTHHSRWIRRGALVLLALGFANVTLFNVRSYPNQIAYFNELVGGPRGAFGRFDQDYWGNCMLQALEWSAETAVRAQMPITVWGNPLHLVFADATRFPQLAVAERSREFHHLALRLNRGPLEGVTELAARPDALHHVKTADGAILCVVLPGPGFDEVQRRLLAAGDSLNGSEGAWP
jgi:hypothetical protein